MNSDSVIVITHGRSLRIAPTDSSYCSILTFAGSDTLAVKGVRSLLLQALDNHVAAETFVTPSVVSTVIRHRADLRFGFGSVGFRAIDGRCGHGMSDGRGDSGRIMNRLNFEIRVLNGET
jgi:hypothetical protein